MAERKAGRPRTYTAAQVRDIVTNIVGRRSLKEFALPVSAKDVAAALHEQHGIAPTMRLDTLQNFVDEVTATLVAERLEADRAGLSPAQLGRLHEICATVEAVVIGGFAAENAEAAEREAVLQAKVAAEEDARRQRYIALRQELDEAKEMTLRLVDGQKQIEAALKERDEHIVTLRLELARAQGMLAAYKDASRPRDRPEA